jgi:hypothetical protein
MMGFLGGNVKERGRLAGIQRSPFVQSSYVGSSRMEDSTEPVLLMCAVVDGEVLYQHIIVASQGRAGHILFLAQHCERPPSAARGTNMASRRWISNQNLGGSMDTQWSL